MKLQPQAKVRLDESTLAPIGPLKGRRKTERGIVLEGADKSEVSITVLAADVLRVRASVHGPLPQLDHSWAIAPHTWPDAPWEAQDGTLTTGEVTVEIQPNPLQLTWRRRDTGRVFMQEHCPLRCGPAGTPVAASLKLGLDDHFYGMGEKAARLDLRRRSFTMWNTDNPAYVEGTDPLYQSIPFYICLDGAQGGQAYGIFLDNSWRTNFDFGRFSQEAIHFWAEGGEMNYYVLWGPSIRKILDRYANLTGHMPLPPKWALGNQQSRYSYYPDDVVEGIVARFRAEDLPLDVLHLDIHYMNDYRVFTWNAERFPHPDRTMARLADQGVKIVTIVDPGVKYQPPREITPQMEPEMEPQDNDYYVYDAGVENNYFLRHQDGSLYIGQVWPGESVFVDYTMPEARRWWGDLHAALVDHGVAGIWNDMNEPADFSARNGERWHDVISYDEGQKAPHAKTRNLFGLLMARATWEGLARLRPNRRPFVITRAGYAGIQRWSTTWTGDNNSTWESLQLSIPMFFNLGLSGQPFVGADVGGFVGGCTGELLVRWYQVSFLVPLCRNHCRLEEYDQEPWRFGRDVLDIVRRYLKLRYRLLPYLYTCLEESHGTGIPLFRPLLVLDQTDPSLYNVDDQFMAGDDLMAAPILRPDVTQRRVYLPRGLWYDFWTNTSLEGGRTHVAPAPLETVPLFVRGGAAIPMGPATRWVDEKPLNPLTWHIYPDADGLARGELYEDDGLTPDYERGAWRRTRLTCERKNNGYRVEMRSQGAYWPGPRTVAFTLHDPGAPDTTIFADDTGNPITLDGAFA